MLLTYINIFIVLEQGSLDEATGTGGSSAAAIGAGVASVLLIVVVAVIIVAVLIYLRFVYYCIKCLV